MNQIQILANQLPIIREIGTLQDSNGIHIHPNRIMENIHVFVYVKSGHIQVIEEEKEYLLSSGCFLFLKKNIHHWGSLLYSPKTEWYYIHFYDGMNQPSEQFPEFTHYQQSSLILEDTYCSKLTLPKQGKVKNKEYTERQLEKLVDLFNSTLPMRPLHLSISTMDFFLELYSQKIQESQHTKKNRIIYKVIEYLNETSSAKKESREIADALGMNYTYLSSLFKKETGKTITQFQNELLVERAMHMLRKEPIHIAEVSNELGFSNPFYFSRVFKKVTGVSPSTYLNEIYRRP
ncbi:helix-turn-helix domain-containing protein [Alkalihalobacillus trypoxylicola]|uniref:PspC family transcriptional regulator n=1 Tax=Alkalihalobacillus trypoxylicola TaxID=519424 RepID=A0A162F4L4_9BACI|nr:AraC family transcriptional regulator [Alkalihalobacillus trypoxylicola]KYG34792.1 PspC family transcriptional regulator [Alkalihalobacillus trypoxylicola]